MCPSFAHIDRLSKSRLSRRLIVDIATADTQLPAHLLQLNPVINNELSGCLIWAWLDEQHIPITDPVQRHVSTQSELTSRLTVCVTIAVWIPVCANCAADFLLPCLRKARPSSLLLHILTPDAFFFPFSIV